MRNFFSEQDAVRLTEREERERETHVPTEERVVEEREMRTCFIYFEKMPCI